MQVYKKELERLLARKPKARSKSIKNPPAIRSYWHGQGGFYAGIICDIESKKSWRLILAEAQTQAAWGGYGETCEGAYSKTDGIQNTQRLLSDKHEHPAAKWTESLKIDGHTDFYLPAQKELMLIYINLQDKCAQRWHWSSTQCSSLLAWFQGFEYGGQNLYGKDTQLAVRAVRRLPL